MLFGPNKEHVIYWL